MKATQHMAGGVGASLALQSITSPTAAAGASAATPANSSGQAAAPTSGGGASA